MEVGATSKYGMWLEKREGSRSRLSFYRRKKDSKEAKSDRMKDEKQDGSKDGKPERSKLCLGTLPASVKRMFSRSRSGRSVSCGESCSKTKTRGTVGNVRYGSWDLLTTSSSHVMSPSFHGVDDTLDSFQDTVSSIFCLNTLRAWPCR